MLRSSQKHPPSLRYPSTPLQSAKRAMLVFLLFWKSYYLLAIPMAAQVNQKRSWPKDRHSTIESLCLMFSPGPAMHNKHHLACPGVEIENMIAMAPDLESRGASRGCKRIRIARETKACDANAWYMSAKLFTFPYRRGFKSHFQTARCVKKKQRS